MWICESKLLSQLFGIDATVHHIINYTGSACHQSESIINIVKLFKQFKSQFPGWRGGLSHLALRILTSTIFTVVITYTFNL